MSKSTRMVVIRLPVTETARSSIAPASAPRPSLPPPFKPVSVRVSKEDIRRACKVEPFPLLPHTFIPVPSAQWKPPVIRYGWPAPKEELLAYARKHGLVRMRNRRNPKLSPDESDGESDSDVDSASDTTTDDNSDDDDSSEITRSSQDSDDISSSSKGDHQSDGGRTVVDAKPTMAPKVWPSRIDPAFLGGVDEYATMLAALEHILDQLSAKHSSPFPAATIKISTTLQSINSGDFIVSVYANYDLLRKKLPAVEQVKEFGEAIGVKTPLKWYIDGDQYEWRPYTKPYRHW